MYSSLGSASHTPLFLYPDNTLCSEDPPIYVPVLFEPVGSANDSWCPDLEMIDRMFVHDRETCLHLYGYSDIYTLSHPLLAKQYQRQQQFIFIHFTHASKIIIIINYLAGRSICNIYSMVGRSTAGISDPRRLLYQGAKR